MYFISNERQVMYDNRKQKAELLNALVTSDEFTIPNFPQVGIPISNTQKKPSWHIFSDGNKLIRCYIFAEDPTVMG